MNINDEHIEVITRHMMRWVRVEDVGDTEFLVDEQVDRFRFMEENERVIAAGCRPATAQPPLAPQRAELARWGPGAARDHQGVAVDRVGGTLVPPFVWRCTRAAGCGELFSG